LWSASIFVAGAVVAGLVLQRGDLTTLASEDLITAVQPESGEHSRVHVCRVRVACR